MENRNERWGWNKNEGGGIFITDGSPLITNCNISGNSASSSSNAPLIFSAPTFSSTNNLSPLLGAPMSSIGSTSIVPHASCSSSFSSHSGTFWSSLPSMQLKLYTLPRRLPRRRLLRTTPFVSNNSLWVSWRAPGCPQSFCKINTCNYPSTEPLAENIRNIFLRNLIFYMRNPI